LFAISVPPSWIARQFRLHQHRRVARSHNERRGQWHRLQSNCAPRFYHGNSVGIGDRARKFAFNHAGMDTSHENVVTFLPQAIGDCADSEFYGAINEALLIPCVALF
jgi:hypothetical protein